MTPDAPENVEEFDDDIDTTAPQDKPAAWRMPEPVFQKTSGRLPKNFEKRGSDMDVISEPSQPTDSSVPAPAPKSPTLKIIVVALALAAMIAFLTVFLTVVYFMFLRSNGSD